MNYIYKGLLGMFFVALVVSLSGSLYYYNKINTIYEEGITYVFDDDAKYHFSLIILDNGDVYWQNFKEGAYEATKANNGTIELNIIKDFDASSSINKYLDIAQKSKMDGVVVIGENSIEQDAAINKLMDAGMKVVVVGQETTGSNVYSYVGTNYYRYGVQTAKLINQLSSDGGDINLAVILSSEYNDDEKVASSQSAIMMNGIKSVIEKYENINLVATTLRGSDLLGAEDATRNIITEYEEVNVIFCTNAMDTEATARVIVERNLVGEIFIIGTGVTENIKTYIEKGVIQGTVDKNGYQAGYKSVELLCGDSNVSLQPDYFDIDTDIYTNINIHSYRNK